MLVDISTVKGWSLASSCICYVNFTGDLVAGDTGRFCLVVLDGVLNELLFIEDISVKLLSSDSL
jgi:hypothetical protein